MITQLSAILLLQSAQAGQATAPDSEPQATASPAETQASEPAGTPQFTRRTRENVVVSLPVVFRDRILGEALAELDPREPDRVSLNLRSIEPLLDQLLNEEGQAQLLELVERQTLAPPGLLLETGITLRYDPNRLELVVERIEPRFATVFSFAESMGRTLPVTLQPERASAYLNILPEFRTRDFENLEATTDLLFGGRVGDFLLEIDGGYDGTDFGPGFFRRQARLIYDDVEAQRRLSAGDLRINNLPLLGTAFVAGIGLQKGRRIYNPFAGVQPLGPQQFLVDQRSTVEVYSGGTLVETLVLEPGAYDLASIPARFGLSDAQLVIVDPAGNRQQLPFDFFFDPTDLQKGEDEYSITVGFPANNLNFNPEYANQVAASGFYRRGITNRLILGAGMQIQEGTIAGAVEAVLSPEFLPGRLSLSGGVSNSDAGTGFAASLNYILLGSAREQFGDLSIGASYQSSEFANLSQRVTGLQSAFTTINANYSRPITDRTSVLATFSYSGRDFAPDFYLGSLEALHRFNDRFFLRGGMEFGTAQGGQTQIGVRVTLTARLGGRARASARYSSVRDTFSANVSQPARDVVGSFGYDATLSQNNDRSEIDLGGTYIGNRLEARGLVLAGGDGFGNFVDDQIVRLNLGTSLAFAGGKFAIGRPILDSFLIADTSEALGDTQVLAGRNLRGDSYDAISGDLGPAVLGRLTSFTTQNITLDITGENAFADIGSGVETVEPPFRSGYLLTVGESGIVSATGTAMIDGEPGALLAGTVSSIDDENFETIGFFTNSVGRFAIIGLSPGFTYRIETNDGRSFDIKVPDDATSLLRFGEIEFKRQGREQ